MSRLFTPILVLPLVVLLMAATMAMAFRADCQRLEHEYSLRVESAVAELKILERRFIQLCRASSDVTADMQRSFSEYEAAIGRDSREATFKQAVKDFEVANRTAKASDEKHRAFLDEADGVLNRLRIAETVYQQEVALYLTYMSSIRGSWARPK